VRIALTVFCGWLPLAYVLLTCMAGCRPQSGQSDPKAVPVQRPGLSPRGVQPVTIEITSSVFSEGGQIPVKYSGEGDDISPPLQWSGVPEGTKQLALICDDPDAPTPEPWVHWVIYKIPADATGLPEGIAKTPELDQPVVAVQGGNSWPQGKNTGYGGPMPPPGHGTHHYYFKLYALDVELTDGPGLDKAGLLSAMSGHVIGQGQLMGTYER